MSQENRPARPSGRPPESGFARLSRTESGLRGPFLCFFASAVLWLVVASVLALVAAVKLHRPDFLGACELTTYGRVVAAAREVYTLYGVPTQLSVAHPNSEHDFPDAQRATAYRLLDAVLR